jgi:hypothetical protein
MKVNNCQNFNILQGVAGANIIYINFGDYANYINSKMKNMVNLMQVHGGSTNHVPPGRKVGWESSVQVHYERRVTFPSRFCSLGDVNRNV